MVEFFARLSREQAAQPQVAGLRKSWTFAIGDIPAYLRLDADGYQAHYSSNFDFEQAWEAAFAYLAQSDVAGARKRLGNFPETIRRRVETEPKNDRMWSSLALYAAIQGDRAEALRALERAQTEAAARRDPGVTSILCWKSALVHIWLGELDAATGDLRRLNDSTFPFFTRQELRDSLYFRRLKGHPVYEAFLADPENWQPRY